MLLRIRERGDGALVHGLRSRRSNRKLAARLEQKILARLRQRYADFGPTLAAEHLAQEGFPGEPGDAAEVDDQGGFVASALPAGAGVHVGRERRACFGEPGDAGQLSVSLAGGSRSGSPSHRADR
jgi:hypothetical protein